MQTEADVYCLQNVQAVSKKIDSVPKTVTKRCSLN